MILSREQSDLVMKSLARLDPPTASRLRQDGSIGPDSVDAVQNSLLELMLDLGIAADGEPTQFGREVDDLCGSIRHAVVMGDEVLLWQERSA